MSTAKMRNNDHASALQAAFGIFADNIVADTRWNAKGCLRARSRTALLAIVSVVASVVLLAGCAQKSFYDPRSTLIERADSTGQPMRSVEDERQAFLAQEKEQKQRLLTLVRTRSENSFRDQNYHVGPGDELEINVFDVPEMNVTAQVRQSGFVSLPLVGAVKAVGLTESELVDDLKKRLKEYVRNPQVSVYISNYGSQKVSVIGAVRRPGAIALKKGGNSLLELIGRAGGVTDKAGNFVNFVPAELSGLGAATDAESRAQLALSGNADTIRGAGIEIALDQVMGTAGGVPIEVPVRGGDMIIVPEAGKVMVEGEVLRGGSFDLGQQMTLLGSLAAAGGITYGAKVDEVEVIRDIGRGEKAHLVLDLKRIGSGEEADPRLRNGDIVRVPSDSGRRLTQDTFDGLSRVINFGVGGSFNVVP